MHAQAQGNILFPKDRKWKYFSPLFKKKKKEKGEADYFLITEEKKLVWLVALERELRP